MIFSYSSHASSSEFWHPDARKVIFACNSSAFILKHVGHDLSWRCNRLRFLLCWTTSFHPLLGLPFYFWRVVADTCLIHGDKWPLKIDRIPIESFQTLLQKSFARLLLIDMQQTRQSFHIPNSLCKMFRTRSFHIPIVSAISLIFTHLSSYTISRANPEMFIQLKRVFYSRWPYVQIFVMSLKGLCPSSEVKIVTIRESAFAKSVKMLLLPG